MKSNKSIGVLGGQGIPVFQSDTPTWFSTFQGSYAIGYQSLYSGDHCCPKRFSSITNFVDFTDLNRCKNAFFDFDPSLT
jgi:hypothetical protein